MRFGTIGDLVTNAGTELESPAVAKLGVELTGEAKQNVSLLAPVVGARAGRVFDHTNADRSKVSGAPQGGAGFASVFGGWDCSPVGGSKWDLSDLHDDMLKSRCWDVALGGRLARRAPALEARAQVGAPEGVMFTRFSGSAKLVRGAVRTPCDVVGGSEQRWDFVPRYNDSTSLRRQCAKEGGKFLVICWRDSAIRFICDEHRWNPRNRECHFSAAKLAGGE